MRRDSLDFTSGYKIQNALASIFKINASPNMHFHTVPPRNLAYLQRAVFSIPKCERRLIDEAQKDQPVPPSIIVRTV